MKNCLRTGQEYKYECKLAVKENQTSKKFSLGVSAIISLS